MTELRVGDRVKITVASGRILALDGCRATVESDNGFRVTLAMDALAPAEEKEHRSRRGRGGGDRR